jgi:dolichol-phosphate mannosyltransferase
LRKKIFRFARFSVLGGVGASFGYLTLYVLTDIMGVWYIISSIAGEVMNFFVNFFVHKYWTFEVEENKNNNHKIAYTVIVVFYFIANTSLMYLLTDLCGVQYVASKVATTLILAWPTYRATKKVFK